MFKKLIKNVFLSFVHFKKNMNIPTNNVQMNNSWKYYPRGGRVIQQNMKIATKMYQIIDQTICGVLAEKT